ncbi:MAG: hypothetical protein ACXWL2_03345 [Candidatus Chromulinivorax sp.]
MENQSNSYIFATILCLATIPMYGYDQDTMGSEIQQEIFQAQQANQEPTAEQILAQTDNELLMLFESFFDLNNTMPFSKFIGKAITILKTKHNLLEDHDEKVKCDEFIKLFEKNKYNSTFHFWAQILLAKENELLSLTSATARNYIHNVSYNIKIQALIQKLRNNKHH